MHFFSSFWHSPVGKYATYVFFGIMAVAWIAGPMAAAKFSETIVTVTGVSGGILTGDAPVLVESWSYGHNLDAGADGSLFGDGVPQPPPAPAPVAPVTNVPPGIAAPQPVVP